MVQYAHPDLLETVIMDLLWCRIYCCNDLTFIGGLLLFLEACRSPGIKKWSRKCRNMQKDTESTGNVSEFA